MSSNFPITPPPELVNKWLWEFAINKSIKDIRQVDYVATRAARWGADTELEACCEWLIRHGWFGSSNHDAIRGLRAARRPKPLGLKQQALAKLPEHPENMASPLRLSPGDVATIRRALESLPD